MEVAIALGILTSEVNHPAFRNRMITFEEHPTWVILNEDDNIDDKVRITAAASWGGSTDVLAAFELIAEVIISHKLPPEEVPDLIIFSDMQFNETAGNEYFDTTRPY